MYIYKYIHICVCACVCVRACVCACVRACLRMYEESRLTFYINITAPPAVRRVLSPLTQSFLPADPRLIAQLHQRAAGRPPAAADEAAPTPARRQLAEHSPQVRAAAARQDEDAVPDGQPSRV